MRNAIGYIVEVVGAIIAMVAFVLGGGGFMLYGVMAAFAEGHAKLWPLLAIAALFFVGVGVGEALHLLGEKIRARKATIP